MEELVPLLPHVNATLNALATVCLATGFVLIKQRRELAHKRAMLAGFCVSILFLASYLVYHANTEAVRRFPAYPPDVIRYTYYFVLASHMLLAVLVPLLVVATIYLALRDRRTGHARLARWTLPVWLYVSLTGVVVYLMLYQFFPVVES
ncbi:MAG: DUF420 domain-containing protein [Planctomycetes bacterium]|nr:DUF420 domain-containing protein [Planctomycetota bacterium]MBL7038576.1 DUF420 domain-containing protein [Pirellulaceae bacterium]